MNFPNQVLTTFIILLCISSSHAQDTKVVVVPLLGDDISQCTAATFCNAGETTLNCPSGDKIIECTAPPKTVFVSSSVHAGNLGGVNGADAICQGLATNAGLTGEFKAWLSGQEPGEPIDLGGGFVGNLLENVSPNTRFVKSTGPYVLVDGTIVAEDYVRLTSGTIRNSISLNESGGPFFEDNVWTNTEPDGRTSNNNIAPCGNFSKTNNNDGALFFTTPTFGNPFEVGGRWTSVDTASCDNDMHLYCFQQ